MNKCPFCLSENVQEEQCNDCGCFFSKKQKEKRPEMKYQHDRLLPEDTDAYRLSDSFRERED